MKEKRAYKLRIYPTPEQAHNLVRTSGCVRFVYNCALRQKTDVYSQEQRRLSYKDLSSLLTNLKKQDEYAWLNEVSCVPTQQRLRHLEKAFMAFFEGHGNYPRCKKKRNRQSAEYTRSAFMWRDGLLTLAKQREPLNIVWSRPLPEGAEPSTVTVSKDCAGRYFVSILVEEDMAPLPTNEQGIGIDLGLTSFVALSEYPSSKRCFDCGYVLDSLSLDRCHWVCPQCGVHHDRDINAANNIAAAGQAVLACGEAVKPAAVKTKAGMPRRSRKPSW